VMGWVTGDGVVLLVGDGVGFFFGFFSEIITDFWMI
jgi:hypothetical protein